MGTEVLVADTSGNTTFKMGTGVLVADIKWQHRL
jgi:hypothetical protein